MTRFTPVGSRADLDAALDASSLAPVILFKHSETCGVSFMARSLFEEGSLPAPVHEIVVQRHRDLSNEVAAQLGVRHESPQALVVVNRRVAWHSSHAGVTVERVSKAWHDAARTLSPVPR